MGIGEERREQGRVKALGGTLTCLEEFGHVGSRQIMPRVIFWWCWAMRSFLGVFLGHSYCWLSVS